MTAAPLPELLTSRLDRPGSGRWRVEGGSARRGDAWTDLEGRVMRVPLGAGSHARLVRAHELMHARVSPIAPGGFERWDHVDPRSVECAEEFRVNNLLARMGFDVRELRDGSERLTGERLATDREWKELIRFAGAVSGTRALADLAAGARRVDPEWARACRMLERDLSRALRGVSTSSLASTSSGTSDLPMGFLVHTRALAEVIDAHVARARRPAARARRRGARPAPTGSFAPLLFDDSVLLDRVVRGGMRLRRKPATSGRRVVRPHRLVTDPARRAFERATRVGGGIVVVDQSGSMSLSTEELQALVTQAPGALVVGYSHVPGSTGVPNAWILADGGRSATTVRAGNIGNGVDAPVLRYALSRRRRGEPLIWICDGQVTDSGDHADPDLATECARLVVRHGIVMVATVGEAIERLGSRSTLAGRSSALGRVAAAASGIV